MLRRLPCSPFYFSQVKDGAWAGRYLFVYMTPELAVNAVGRLRHLRDTQARGAPSHQGFMLGTTHLLLS